MNNFKIAFLIGLILIIAFLAFLPCLENGFVNWDDIAYTTEVMALQHLSFKNVKHIFTSFSASLYQPINRLSYLSEYNFFKLDTFVYHLTNIILHLFACLSVFWLIYLLTQEIALSSITAILFAVHPLHVESVAWVSGRQDVFCALFFFLALVSYCYYLRQKRINKYYYFSLILFIFSLLSKAMSITLPVILFLVDYFYRRRPDKRIFLDKIPFFLLSFVFGIVAIIGKYLGGPVNDSSLTAIPNKIEVFSYSIVFYINKILLPVKLSCFYPESIIKDTPFLYSFIIIAALFIVVAISRKYTRKVIFGSLFFLVTILPVIRFVPFTFTIVADRYAYIPSMGLFFIIACGFLWIYKRVTKNNLWIKLFLVLILIAMVGVLSCLTWKRCQVWKDSFTLWSDTLKNYPNVAAAYNNLGIAHDAKGDHNQAISYFNKAIELNRNFAAAYNNLGIAYRAKGNYSRAIANFNKTVQLDPGYVAVYNNRGMAYFSQGNLDQAISDYNKAIRLNPNSAEIYNNRGNAYDAKGNHDQAIFDYSKAIELNPNNVNAYSNRALTNAMKGNFNQAVYDFSKAIELNPGFAFAYYNRGVIYFHKKDYDKAWDDVLKAESLGYNADPNFLNDLKNASGGEK